MANHDQERATVTPEVRLDKVEDKVTTIEKWLGFEYVQAWEGTSWKRFSTENAIDLQQLKADVEELKQQLNALKQAQKGK